MKLEDFVGREAEARLILANVEKNRNALIIGESGVGKSALLAYLEPVLQEMGLVLWIG